jgi:hypothetical protein
VVVPIPGAETSTGLPVIPKEENVIPITNPVPSIDDFYNRLDDELIVLDNSDDKRIRELLADIQNRYDNDLAKILNTEPASEERNKMLQGILLRSIGEQNDLFNSLVEKYNEPQPGEATVPGEVIVSGGPIQNLIDNANSLDYTTKEPLYDAALAFLRQQNSPLIAQINKLNAFNSAYLLKIANDLQINTRRKQAVNSRKSNPELIIDIGTKLIRLEAEGKVNQLEAAINIINAAIVDFVDNRKNIEKKTFARVENGNFAAGFPQGTQFHSPQHFGISAFYESRKTNYPHYTRWWNKTISN